MKKATDLYAVGDIMLLQMQQPREGKRPIARTDEGFICLLERDTKGFFEYGSSWDCEVVAVKDTVVIIKPTTLYLTARQNDAHVKALAERMITTPKKEHKKKAKTEYRYASKQELIK